jgi:hypothetical protein
MKPCQKPPPRSQNLAFNSAFERLDAALAEGAPFDDREKIRIMREAFNKDVEEFWVKEKMELPRPRP